MIYLSEAQTPFAQVNQLPLQLNPSMAGSKENKRVSFGMNALNQDLSKYSNLAVGYDQMSRRLSSGIGAYFLYRNLKDNMMTSETQTYLPDQLSQKKYFNDQKQYLAGFCIAPKYTIKSAKSHYKPKYTFSPSLFLEVGKTTNSSILNFNAKNCGEIIYSSDHPDGIQLKDSIISDYVQYNFSNNIIRSGIGLQLNSGKLLLLSKISFERSAYNEHTIISTYSYNTKTEQQSESVSDAVLYSIEPNINFSYSFSRSEHAAFVFTPIVGVGMKHYFNLSKSTGDQSGDAYRFLLNNSSVTQLSYVHISANARYDKMLFGFAYTEYFSSTFEGLTLGFQNDWVKVMGTMGKGIIGKDRNYKLFELTTDILIR
ncbi:hypothetical protein [Cytophaga aurantiaca]|uniref:hypothetical protein n=1 Tax=Cytophaga aurantiaca TaxID=29530 RepID=UPI0012FB0E6F|nr:hypothetical protein [Cytophaga aurantiaca]